MNALVSFTLKKLDELLTGEFRFLRGVKEDVVWIKDELKSMQAFIRDAETKQGVDEKVLAWISTLRKIAYDIEDVIDIFNLEAQDEKTTDTMGALKGFVKDSFRVFRNADRIHNIGNKIQAIRRRVVEHSARRVTYGITTQEGISGGTTSKWREQRMTTSFEDEEHVVGFDDEYRCLQKKLFLPEPMRSVISILGMGGLGKTTLARKLYNENKFKFGKHAWICVSQEWETRDLLQRIIKSLTNDEFSRLEKMDTHDMERYLREILKDYRYMIVIDDMWEEQVWQSLKRALPENHHRSRIIVTTRKKDVAELSDKRTYVHKLRFLQAGESWELFCKKVFIEDDTDGRSQDLQMLGKEMVGKCDGLPLAIIVLGGLLSRKQHVKEWRDVKKRIWRELENKSDCVLLLLELSYQDLPPELQSCFLYFCFFPEDFIIDTEILIRLWVTESFVSDEEPGMELEELAESYLEELRGRSLIQAVQRRQRVIKKCRVHDLMRDLVVNKAKELDFLHILDSTKESSGRRIVVNVGNERDVALSYSNEQVRTLALIDSYSSLDGDSAKKLMELVCTRFRLLKVLELQGIKIAINERKLWLGTVMRKLIYLKYLGLQGMDIEELPESIGNLQALQTLHLSSTKPCVLPIEMRKLKQLRHLIGRFEIKDVRKKGNLSPILFGELTNLRFLMDLDISGWVRQKEKGVFALEAFSKLQNLKRLNITFFSDCMLSVESFFGCKGLLDLEITGKLQRFPNEMHNFLPNLKYLHLYGSELKEDPMPILELLPNLLILYIDSLEVNILTFVATGFPQLEIFNLNKSSDLLEIHMEEGAMPKLKFLNFEDSKKHLFPERLRCLPRIRNTNR